MIAVGRGPARAHLYWFFGRLLRALPVPQEHAGHGPLVVLDCCGAPACTACDRTTIVANKNGKGYVHWTSLPYIRWSPYCAPAAARPDEPLEAPEDVLAVSGG